MNIFSNSEGNLVLADFPDSFYMGQDSVPFFFSLSLKTKTKTKTTKKQNFSLKPLQIYNFIFVRNNKIGQQTFSQVIFFFPNYSYESQDNIHSDIYRSNVRPVLSLFENPKWKEKKRCENS